MHSLTDSLSHSLTGLLIHSQSLIDWLIDWLKVSEWMRVSVWVSDMISECVSE